MHTRKLYPSLKLIFSNRLWIVHNKQSLETFSNCSLVECHEWMSKGSSSIKKTVLKIACTHSQGGEIMVALILRFFLYIYLCPNSWHNGFGKSIFKAVFCACLCNLFLFTILIYLDPYLRILKHGIGFFWLSAVSVSLVLFFSFHDCYI